MFVVVLIGCLIVGVCLWLLRLGLREARRSQRRAALEAALAEVAAAEGVVARIRLHQALCEAEAAGIDVRPYLHAQQTEEPSGAADETSA